MTRISQEEIEELIRLSLEQLETLVIVDKDSKIVFLNENYARILNTDPLEAVGRPVQDLIPSTGMPFVIENGKSEIGTLFTLNDGRTIVTNRIPILKDGVVIGGIAFSTFKRLDEVNILTEAIKRKNLELSLYKSELSQIRGSKYSINQIIGNTPVMKLLKENTINAAATKSNVLITGETGTGKELFAHAIHTHSSRNFNNFVRLNCASIPNDLLESELFGYEEGAFTGAKKGGKPGKFELADGGTLLLDEINSLPLILQSKLLRAIQEREVDRVGSITPQAVDIKLICTTNVNLGDLVNKGQFREDLYYRINVVEINVPPLRDRKDDIDSLVEHFIKKINKELGFYIEGVTPGVLKLFKSYQWPGNVRELENILERVANNVHKSVLTPEHFIFLAERIRDRKMNANECEANDFKSMKERLEKQSIIEALKKCGGNKKKAAELLNLDRSVLYDKIRKYSITE